MPLPQKYCSDTFKSIHRSEFVNWYNLSLSFSLSPSLLFLPIQLNAHPVPASKKSESLPTTAIHVSVNQRWPFNANAWLILNLRCPPMSWWILAIETRICPVSLRPLKQSLNLEIKPLVADVPMLHDRFWFCKNLVLKFDLLSPISSFLFFDRLRTWW